LRKKIVASSNNLERERKESIPQKRRKSIGIGALDVARDA